MQYRPNFVKFSTIADSTFLRRLWTTNLLDLILDFSLTFVSVVFNYSGPFFLQRILDTIDLEYPTRSSRKPDSSVHLRLLGIYVHTTQAQDGAAGAEEEGFSGIANKEEKGKGKDKTTMEYDGKRTRVYPSVLHVWGGADGKSRQDKAEKKQEKAKTAKTEDPKIGADVGKIVNLMAEDADHISQTVSGCYFIFGVPFEILIPDVFLYRLERIRRVHRPIGGMASQQLHCETEYPDPEGRVGSRVNSVMFYLLWTCAPILVSIVSFFVLVMQGGELTISVAFTYIALCGMVRTPLDVIPTWIVQILQTGVALNHIAVYLDEEVTDQVTSLQKDLKTEPHLPDGEDQEGLGLENATLKWNEVVDAEKQKEQDKMKNEVLSPGASSDIPSPTSSNDDVEAAATSDVETGVSDSGSLLAGSETTTSSSFEIQQFGFQRTVVCRHWTYCIRENGSSCTSSYSIAVCLVLIARLPLVLTFLPSNRRKTSEIPIPDELVQTTFLCSGFTPFTSEFQLLSYHLSATARFSPSPFPPAQRRLLALHNGRAASRALSCVWREQQSSGHVKEDEVVSSSFDDLRTNLLCDVEVEPQGWMLQDLTHLLRRSFTRPGVVA
ncbi:hypothetical protein K443DRAFT_14463 [Laccaria amethystina LaAM-08-1]|uniref:Uncharacterized protein n=1 Tax=Laccaria amethystina LaAM-08-1 TaxID=1095629 RepID=A0A0C9WHK6_9AGAR|nr:hypothetical protein K443DRAFT_14463 [Laccaria amethystina LaAM-08-1]